MAAALELARTAPRGRKRAREGGEHSDKMAKLEDDAASRLAGDCLERSAALDAWSTPLSVNSSGGGGGEGRGGVCGQKGQPVRCRSEFFNQSCTELARSMLDCVLVSAGESGEVCRGRVVETEAYLGGEDKASHSYNGRRSRANEAMFMAPGTAYVYSIYGMHSCFNVSSRGAGAAVLVRALEPISGQEEMRRRGRGGRRGTLKDAELCNGPGKLCQAMGISKSHNQDDLLTSCRVWLERGKPLPPKLIRVSARIGINSSGPVWSMADLRFYQLDCTSVSKPGNRGRTALSRVSREKNIISK